MNYTSKGREEEKQRVSGVTSLAEAGENLESLIDLVKKRGWGQTPQGLGAGLEQLLAGSHASFILSPWVAWYSARLVLRKFLLNEFTLYTVRETDLNKKPVRASRSLKNKKTFSVEHKV